VASVFAMSDILTDVNPLDERGNSSVLVQCCSKKRRALGERMSVCSDCDFALRCANKGQDMDFLTCSAK